MLVKFAYVTRSYFQKLNLGEFRHIYGILATSSVGKLTTVLSLCTVCDVRALYLSYLLTYLLRVLVLWFQPDHLLSKMFSTSEINRLSGSSCCSFTLDFTRSGGNISSTTSTFNTFC